jgi:hypothetical protein
VISPVQSVYHHNNPTGFEYSVVANPRLNAEEQFNNICPIQSGQMVPLFIAMLPVSVREIQLASTFVRKGAYRRFIRPLEIMATAEPICRYDELKNLFRILTM